MKRMRFFLLGAALTLPFAGGVFGAPYNAGPNWTLPNGEPGTVLPNASTIFYEAGGPDGVDCRESSDCWTHPTRSGAANIDPMDVTIGFVSWSSGSVDIPISLDQRGRVWVIIYEANAPAGIGGLNGAIDRRQAGPKHVATTAMEILEAGSSTITWDGNRADGTAAPAGNYIYDVMAFNDLDDHVVVGPGQSWAWGANSIDHRLGEVWSPFKETPPDQVYWGDMRNDFVENPTAFETYQITSFGPDEPRNYSGNQIDDENSDIHWTSRRDDNEELGTVAGILKLNRNRANLSLDWDTGYADAGVAPGVQGGIWAIAPVGGRIYAADNAGEANRTHVNVYSKTTGDLVAEYDMFELMHYITLDDDGNEQIAYAGPTHLDAGPGGILISVWRNPNFVHLDLNGNVKWVNGIGDGYIEHLTLEHAETLGITGFGAGTRSVTVGIFMHPAGKAFGYVDQHNGTGYNFGLLGRDGTGLMHHQFSPQLGPWFLSSSNKHGEIIDGGSPWDGLYVASGANLVTGLDEGETAGPGSMMYFPFRIATSSIGSSATAVAEISDVTPDAYALGDAYPNPFNPTSTIEFKVPEDTHVMLNVYNMAGQLVTSLVNEELTAGTYKTEWDARDLAGAEVSSGSYIYRIEAGNFVESGKLTFLK